MNTTGLITVAICTYNRAEYLRLVLEDLASDWAECQLPIELLVIENNCHDHTAEVVNSFLVRLPIRIESEPRQGLAIARNRAIALASGELLLFLDDDVRVKSGWLRAYQDAFSDSSVLIAGGKIIPIWPEQRPRWCGTDGPPPFSTIVPHVDLGDEPLDISDIDIVPVTANLGFRMSAFAALGGFREDLGTVGGEDIELISRGLALYGSVRYVPAAVVDHPVYQSRLSLGFNFRYLHRGGIAQSRFEPIIPGTQCLFGLPLWLFRKLGRSAVSCGIHLLRGQWREAAVAGGGVATVAGVIRGLWQQKSERNSS